MKDSILTINDKKEEKILRRRTQEFEFKKYSKGEIKDLIKKMREVTKKAEGIGLSANQIGLDMRVFVAKVNNKFYALFNPEILKESKEKVFMEEGCLSVPGILGLVERPEKLQIAALDINNKKIKIKAWGLLSRVFQHEIDHLNGKLFIDKAVNLRKYNYEEENARGQQL